MTPKQSLEAVSAKSLPLPAEFAWTYTKLDGTVFLFGGNIPTFECCIQSVSVSQRMF